MMCKPRYRLLKDLPVGEAGDIVFEHDGEVCFEKLGTLCSTGLRASMLYENSWFEEIQEPTDSIHWKPRIGERCWSFLANGEVAPFCWSTLPYDLARYELGNIYRTEKECEKVRDRKLAEVRLRRTSTFEPDFENDSGGWIVYYDHECETLAVFEIGCYDAGEITHYKTKEGARKSIEENRADWLIYFGVEKD